MNVFILHTDPGVAAMMHCDKHVVKMILEMAQLLSTAHRVVDGDDYADRKALYKATHRNHPSAVWVRSSKTAYRWTYQLFVELLFEYTYRYQKIHACGRLIEALRLPPALLYGEDAIVEDIPTALARAAQAMPDQYRVPGDPVAAYRAYYKGEKAAMATWKVRGAPGWWDADLALAA